MSVGWLKSNRRGVARRAFLGGAGTVVALPLMESLLPRSARAAAAAPKRIIYYYVPDGIVMKAWKPTIAGATWDMTPIIKPIEALRSDFMVVSNTRNDPARPNPGPGDHAAGTSGFITCATAFKSTTMIKLGISADQVVANYIAKNSPTRVPSVVLGMEAGAQAGTCDSGFGCPYVRAISWSSETTPMPKITDAKTAFDLVFMGFDPGATASDQLKRQKQKKSVLDAVTAQGKSLQTRLGTTDRRKLDEYFTSVTEVEREVTAAPGGVCNTGMPPAAGTTDFEKTVNTMSDIMVLAMQCDVSRVFSFMLGNAGGQHVYSNLGITRGHHDISHHGGQAVNLSQLQTIDTYEITLLGYLLNKMKATTDGDQTLLYNSTVYFSSEISDGDAHNHDDMPVLIAGQGGGLLNSGQHYALPTTTKVANVLVALMRTVGLTDGKLGDSTGPEMELVKA